MATIADSYSEAFLLSTSGLSATGSQGTSFGQSFTGDGGKLLSSVFHLKKSGTPTGNITSILYAHIGTFGTSSVPGSVLATSDNFDCSTLTTSSQLITFTFSGANQFQLQDATKYIIAVDVTGVGDSANSVIVSFGGTVNPHPGCECKHDYTPVWVNDAGRDICFYVYSDRSVFGNALKYVHVGDGMGRSEVAN